MVAIIKTLKLMVLIIWDSLRHPLTESVIDYTKARVLKPSCVRTNDL